MKLNILAAYIAMPLSLYACKENSLPDYETKVKVQVMDDSGNAIPRIKVDVTHDYMAQTKDNGKQAITDRNGNAETSAKSLATIWIRTSSQEHYPSFEDEVANVSGPQDYTASPLRELRHSIILRKIIKPIPLYAKQNDIPIPEKDKWIGFDLGKADWVKPYGVGASSDVEFYLENQHLEAETINGETGISRVNEIREMHESHPRNKQGFLDSRDEFYRLRKGTSTYEESILFRMHPWQGTVKMRVPCEKGGILAEKEKYLIYSKAPQTDYARFPVPEMRMPHHAPKAGYQQEYEWKKTSADQLTIDEKLGFFIKTQVKLDEQGREISAHYAKFITDVKIDIRGRIQFTSYFNPTANDTNLEFDLKKNLIKDLKELEMPYLP